MTSTCKCFSCEFTRAVEASFPNGVDREAGEAILAILAAHAGNLIAQMGPESLVSFSIQLAMARAESDVGPQRPAGSVH